MPTDADLNYPARFTYLTFHGVGSVPRHIDPEERHCWLDRVHLEEILDVVKNYPQVRLTVDDGNASDHFHLLPAFIARGLKAVFFVCSDRLDQPTFLSRTQVRDLVAHGMTIGSHGAAHLPWRSLPASSLHHELNDSRKVLEDLCQSPIDSAACPFGSYNRRVLSGLRRAGYRITYTSDGGFVSNHQWIRGRTTVTRSHAVRDVSKLVTRGPGLLRRARIALGGFVKRNLC